MALHGERSLQNENSLKRVQETGMIEEEQHQLVSVRASVMIYQEESKRWEAAGGVPGLLQVGLVQARSGVKIVAKSSSGETFVDLPLRHGLRYHKATPVFHQWRDDKRRVWGLAFSAAEQADTFAFSMQGALEALGLEEERRKKREEEREMVSMAMEEKERRAAHGTVPVEEKVGPRDGGGGWSPKKERWEAGYELQERLAGKVQQMWLENNYTRAPDYKVEQGKLQQIQDGGAFKIEASAGTFTNYNEEEEEIYEQLDSPDMVRNGEEQKKILSDFNPGGQKSGWSEWEKGKVPFSQIKKDQGLKLDLGNKNHMEANKSHPEFDEKLYVALSCLSGSTKSSEDDIDDIYMKKSNFWRQSSDLDRDQTSYFAFERPELLYGDDLPAVSEEEMSDCKTTCTRLRTTEEFICSGAWTEHSLSEASLQRCEANMTAVTDGECPYFMPVDYTPDPQYLEMYNIKPKSMKDQANYFVSDEEGFEEKEVVAFDKPPVNHLLAAESDPPPFIGPLLPSPTLLRTPTSSSAPSLKRTTSAPPTTLAKPSTPPTTSAPPPPPPPPPPPTSNPASTPTLRSDLSTVKLKSSLTPAVPDLMQELQRTLGRRRTRVVTSADLVLAEEEGGEQGDREKGEQVTGKRSATTEPVAAISVEDQRGDEQGEEGDQGIRRRTRAVTADPVLESGVEEIKVPLQDWQASTGKGRVLARAKSFQVANSICAPRTSFNSRTTVRSPKTNSWKAESSRSEDVKGDVGLKKNREVDLDKGRRDADLARIKEEIVKEVREEVLRAKEEIMDAIMKALAEKDK